MDTKVASKEHRRQKGAQKRQNECKINKKRKDKQKKQKQKNNKKTTISIGK